MRIDMHCHVIGNGIDINNVDNDVYWYAKDNQHWLTRIVANLVENDLIRMEGDFNRDGIISTAEYFELLYRLFSESKELDGIVLIALDAFHSHETGLLDEKRTDLWVSNRFLSKKVKQLNARLQKETVPEKRNKKFFFGASVSPNNPKWETELDYVLTETDAVLIKLIPSTQDIWLKDLRHTDYYNTLASSNMPLLCHVGPEYSFPEGLRNKSLDNFRNLKKALECGVTVIAAHCATPVFPLIDANEIKEFYKFMISANSGEKVKLWADTSALSLSTRLPFIQEILETFPPQWLMHGSDFPIPIDGWPHMPLITHDITPEEYIEISKTANPFDRDIKIKKAHGFSDSVINNAEAVLRMPKEGYKNGVTGVEVCSEKR